MTDLEGECSGDTPSRLATATTRALPLVVLVGEEDGVLAASLLDRLESDSLLLGAGTAIVAERGPASLHVDNLVARADTLEEVKLTIDERTGRFRSDGLVEVRVNVGSGDLAERAKSTRDVTALPGVEGLSGTVGTLVAGAARLDVSDELSELRRRAETVLDGLVSNDEELHHLPFAPVGNGVDLRLDVGSVNGAAGGLDEDTNDQGETVLLASRDNSLVGVAVSGVNADGAETGLLELGNVRVNSTGSLAAAALVVVGRVRDGPAVGGASHVTNVATRGLAGGSGSGRRGGLDLRRGGRLSGGRGRSRLGERAVVDGTGLGDGDSGVRSSVGTRSEARGGRVDHDSLLSDGGRGVRVDNVGAGRRADVGGHDDGAGDLVVLGVNSGNRAGHDGGGGDDRGDTANGVSARRNLGGSSSADGGGLVDGDGRGGNGVGSGSRAHNGVRSRNNLMDGRQRLGRDSLGLGGGAGRRDGGRGDD